MNAKNKGNSDTSLANSGPGFLKLVFGLFGIFLTYWAGKEAFMYTVVFMRITAKYSEMPPRIIGEMSAPIVGYVLVVLIGLLLIRMSFKKAKDSE